MFQTFFFDFLNAGKMLGFRESLVHKPKHETQKNIAVEYLNMKKHFFIFLLFMGIFLGSSHHAKADLKLCNNTSSHIGVAFGYKDLKGWVSEGWFNIKSKECKTLLTGKLIARYYYVYAVDYKFGGSWGGDKFMCTKDESFTIRGRTNCVANGYKKTGFSEVDTGEETDWTVQLYGTAGKQ